MAMNEAFSDVTFASGPTVTGTWKHPDQIRSSAPEAVELDDVPQEVWHEVTASDGVHQGLITIQSKSASGFTLLSTHLQDASTVRVFARVKVPLFDYQYG